MAIRCQWNGYPLTSHGLDHPPVECEGGISYDGLGTRAKKTPRTQIDQLTAAVPQRDMRDRQPKPFGQPHFQIVPMTIGVTVNALKHILYRLDRQWRGS
jgi:hypothetical protein